jgi:hypothetical protein
MQRAVARVALTTPIPALLDRRIGDSTNPA